MESQECYCSDPNDPDADPRDKEQYKLVIFRKTGIAFDTYFWAIRDSVSGRITQTCTGGYNSHTIAYDNGYDVLDTFLRADKET